MLDSNVLISGCAHPRYCFEILNYAFKQEFNLLMSEIVIREASKNIHKKFPNFADSLNNFLSNCPFEIIKHLGDSKLKSISMRDKKDIPILLSAIESRADFFVTGDKDFLEDKKINQQYKNQFIIIAPKLFLKNIMGWSEKDLDKIRLRKWEDLKKQMS